MFKYETPEQYESGQKGNMLSALRCHCTDQECAACSYSSDIDCDNILIDLFPSFLRSLGDDVSLTFADQLERCNQYSYETCSGCRYFSVCFVKEDSLPLLTDLYKHLLSKGCFD